MTLADALNEHACTCGLDEGRIWFRDGNGQEPDVIDGFRLIRNNNGIRVEQDRYGWLVSATSDGGRETVFAAFTSDLTWIDVN